MTIASKKLDRRIQRTRELLRTALIELIEECGYDGLSIQDITDRANVSRTTFYLHFRDKDDLLFTSMEDLYDNLVSHMTIPTPDELLSKGFLALTDTTDFQHVAAHAKFYKVMIGKHGSAAFLMRVQSYLAQVILTVMLKPLLERGTTPNLPIEVIAHAMAGLEIGLIRWWLEDDNLAHTPDEMALMTCKLSIMGVGWAMGIPPQLDEFPSGLMADPAAPVISP